MLVRENVSFRRRLATRAAPVVPTVQEADLGLFDEEPAKKKIGHEIGQDISLLSVEELRERILLLKTEIERIESELTAKGASKAAAEALFR